MHPPLKGLMILATAGLSSLAIAAPNGDFSDVKPVPDETIFDVEDIGVGFLPSWTILRNLSAGIADTSAAVANENSTIPGAPTPISGSGAFSFAHLTGSRTDSVLAQCVPIDSSKPIDFSYQIFTNRVANFSGGQSFELYADFYADMKSCNEDLQAGGVAEYGRDFEWDVFLRDIRLSNTPSGNWELINRATTTADDTDGAPMSLTANQIPNDAEVVRWSLGMRSFGSADITNNVRYWLDDIRVVQDGKNLVVNHDFSHPDLKDGDFVTADDSGWQLALSLRNGVTPLASAGALPFALNGENGFYLKRLTGEYEDGSLVQCISRGDIPSVDLRPSFNVASDEPASGLMAAVRAEFFTDDACVDADTLDDLEGELAITGDPRQWQFVQTTDFINGNSIAGDGSMRLTLSVRDRSGDNDAPDGELARTVFMDDVKLEVLIARPTFSPGGQSFTDTLVVTVNGPAGSTLYITMDGTDPDTSSMALQPGETIELTQTTELRAVASDGQEVSAVQSATYTRIDSSSGDNQDDSDNQDSSGNQDASGNQTSGSNRTSGSSFSCSMGGGANDPVLPMLALLALLGFARRKLRSNA